MYRNFSFDKTGRVMTLSKLQENQFSVSKFHSQKLIDLQQKSSEILPRLRVSSYSEANFGIQPNQQTKYALDYLATSENRLNQSDGFQKKSVQKKFQATNFPFTTKKNSFEFNYRQKLQQNSSRVQGSSMSEKSSAFSNIDNLIHEKQMLEKSTQQIYNYNEKRQKEEQILKQLKKDINFIQKQIQEEQKAAKNINGLGTIIYQQKQKIEDNTFKFGEQMFPIKKEKESLLLEIRQITEVKKQMIQKNQQIIEQIAAEQQLIDSLKSKIEQVKGISQMEKEDRQDILNTKAKQYAQIEIK